MVGVLDTMLVALEALEATLEALELAAEDTTEDALEEPPVERLTCLLSTFARASSISLAGTVDADMIANRRKFGRYMVEACTEDSIEKVVYGNC